MKKLTVALYIVLLAFAVSVLPKTSFAAAQCQVIYGGGEICQDQKLLRFTYPISQLNPTPTPIQFTIPQTRSLPSTGTSIWGILLIGLSGIGGVVLLLL